MSKIPIDKAGAHNATLDLHVVLRGRLLIQASRGKSESCRSKPVTSCVLRPPDFRRCARYTRDVV
jgi:hypothetical protein